MTVRDYDVTEEHMRYYSNEGYVLLPGLIETEAIASIQPIITRLMGNIEPRSSVNIRERTDLGESHLEIKKFVTSSRWADVAARLMGVKEAKLLFDCAFYKKPGDSQTLWHQDNTNWNGRNLTTMWFPLTEASAAMGSLTFLSGSHHSGETSIKQAIRRHAAIKRYDAMRLGDATFHTGWTFHSAPPVPGEQTREAFALLFIAA